jgi:sugar-phosphatase
MRPFKQAHAAFLFDMDGTILTSIAAAERVWGRWALQHGLDPATFLPTIHGARAVDTIRRLGLPGVDPEVEAEKIMLAELDDVEGIAPIAGAEAFLRSLPPERWGIVTSAPRALARRRIEAVGLPSPPLWVTAEDVIDGKPNPACYRLAAERLGVPAEACLVFEDATAGILAAEAAGADVMVVTATHQRPLETSHRQCRDYRGLRASLGDGGAGLELAAA